MPRHDRLIPVRLGRFNYWQYTCAHPPTDPAVPSADRIAHAEMQKTFQQIRDERDTPRAQRHRRHFETEINRLGIDEPTSAIVALAFYLTTDRLSSQDSEAQTLLAQQPAEIQDALRTWARGVWRRRTLGAWKALLKTIARDQALFAEILTLGPTCAGLAGTRQRSGTKLAADLPPIWGKYHVSEAVAQRVYREYHAEMSALLGRGRRVSENVRAFFRSQGIEAPRVRQTPIMPDLAGRPADEQVPIILHWFAHALRNLARYRNGHPPRPWHATACRTRCLQVQRQLMA
jgi:hypothetical protein